VNVWLSVFGATQMAQRKNGATAKTIEP